MILLCQKMLVRQNIDKFYLDKNDFIIKQLKLRVTYMETRIKS